MPAGLRVLAIDVGGTRVKLCLEGRSEVRRRATGRGFTPDRLVAAVRGLAADWEYDVISIGFPAPIADGRPAQAPLHLGEGWVGFDLARALDRPTRVWNDAALQALGSDRGGTMLFVGLGTGVGTALVSDGRVLPLELAQLPFREGRSFEDELGKGGLARLGPCAWRAAALEGIERWGRALRVDSVVVGGGNAPRLGTLPPGVFRGHSALAFEGAFRLWDDARPPGSRGARQPVFPEPGRARAVVS